MSSVLKTAKINKKKKVVYYNFKTDVRMSNIYLGEIIQSTYCLINCTASSYFIPHSIKAKATSTGAL